MVLFITLDKAVLTFEFVDEIFVSIQMKAIEQYFSMKPLSSSSGAVYWAAQGGLACS